MAEALLRSVVETAAIGKLHNKHFEPSLTLKSCSTIRFSSQVKPFTFVSQKYDCVVVRAAKEEVRVQEDVKGAVLPSGEWPENFSILNYEDLSAHYEPAIFKDELQPSTYLADVMSKRIYTCSPCDLLESVDHYFIDISGLPVVDENLKCVGVLSKKDKIKASKGLKSTVEEVMTSPAITLSADKTVSDAAVLMLKNKIHRIPIVNESNQVVGIVTRTDIFSALEGGS
ncbi:hypothetical protein O6H91_10G034600 [Diphasiastrum complanatum]|uniref:Uncharacterized protein n=1 Tax=Diphasiastrum complanatum TaxID=34168 RepID=A0ACC2CFQ8_DIPCM|nr:hypothetical protein O6H91_10G034600 [Diphasiastrum complanatum]